MSAPGRPRVSIVLSTCNRCALLPNAIEGLLAQRDAPPHEILVIDNRSTDRTAAVVHDLARQARGRLSYVYEPRQGLSHARNAGIARARAAIVAFTDDDVVAGPEWVAEIAAAFERHQGADYVGGRVLPRWPAAPPPWLTPAHWSPLALQDHGLEAFRVDSARPICLVGANMAFRADVFQRCGGFSPDVQLTPGAAGSTEDHELMRRVWASGGHGVYVPSIVVRADVPGERMARRYHRRWHYAQGRFHARMRIPEMERSRARLLDVPAHLFRQAALDLVAPARRSVRREPPEAFLAVARLCFFAGFVRERVPDAIRGRAAARDASLRPIRRWAPAEPPLVSVVIPCHNQARYLSDAIRSALSQSHRPLEVIVVDDGSSDDTAEVAGTFDGVQCVRQSRGGLSRARNAGLARSRGSLVVFLDADDRLLPDAVERGLAALRARPDAAAAYGVYRVIDTEGQPIFTAPDRSPEADAYAELLRSNTICAINAVLFRRDALDRVGGFDPTVNASADYDLYLRIARRFPLAAHNAVVADYRSHPGAMSRNPALMLATTLAVHRRHWRHARADPHRRQAYQQGRVFWREFFGDQLMDDVRRAVRAGRLARGAAGLVTLARHAPRRLLWHARRWARKRVARSIPAAS